MIVQILFYIAFAVFAFGLFYKVSTWFRYKIGIRAKEISTPARVFAAVKGITKTILSKKVFTLLKVFMADDLFQFRILREDFLRWFMHMCIYGGFVLLLCMHALGEFITASVFSEYSSTLNPFMFLRDLSGALVILGLIIAVYRRFILKVPRLRTNAMDYYAIIIVAVIILSGFILEGTKIVSYSIFKQMAEDYAGLEDDKELRSLESFWVDKYGVVSPRLKRPFKASILASGEELSEGCIGCHSRPGWAFAGYGLAKIMGPIAPGLDKANAPTVLWYFHYLACLLGLAYLPFSKMFHMITTPLSLLANAVMDKETSDPANIATRQAMELDACTHCGTCSLHCSMAFLFEKIPNVNILPSEKIDSLKPLAAGKELNEQELKDIREGIYLCTNCRRCTVVCPAGINLQDLWFNARESLLEKGYPEFLTLSPLSFYRGLMKEDGVCPDYQEPIEKAKKAIFDECRIKKGEALSIGSGNRELPAGLNLSVQANTFSVCFGCETCTASCPVVANYDNPQEVLGLLPHQIMHSAGLGIRELAFGSNMLWDCLTCYQCQERCPQGVSITDVMYELKNLAVQHVKEKMLG